MKNKLIIVQPALGRYRKGFIESLVKENKDFYNISVYCSPTDNSGVKSMNDIDASINYVKVKLSRILNVFFWQHLVRQILGLKLSSGDKLVINGNPRFLSSMLLIFCYRLKGVDIYWWGHGWSSTSSSLGSYIRFKLMNFFNIILYTEDEVNRLKGIVQSPMVGLNNGLDVEKIRDGININEDKFETDYLHLAFIGRITPKSNFYLLIDALTKLQSQFKNKIKLSVIGDVSQTEIESYNPDSKNLHITLHGEIWSEKEISEILVDSHVFAYPGAVGLSVIHAFALGLPALLHNNRFGHMPEIAAFEDSYNGLSFTENSSEDLAEKMVYLLQNKPLLIEMSRNAFQTVSHTFNTQDMAKKFIDFVRKENE